MEVDSAAKEVLADLAPSSSVASTASSPGSVQETRSPSNSTCSSWSDKPESSGDFQAAYTLSTRVLGTGASCTVFEAMCQRTNRKVAVKSFRKRDMPSGAWESVLRECQVLQRIDHPNVLKVEDVYQEGNKAVHMVMERLDGGELFDRVLQKQGLPEAEAARVAIQLLRALGHLHARRITHRDLKPGNIMYAERDGDLVKLIDYGFATFWEEGQRLSERCGTLQYTAPEVLSAGGYTWKADMWSLGGVMYSTLVARLLYAGSNAEVSRKNRLGKVDFSENFLRLSALAQDFVRSLLVVDEEQRPDVLEALRHPWLQSQAPEEAAAAHEEPVAELQAQTKLAQEEGSSRRSELAATKQPQGTATYFDMLKYCCDEIFRYDEFDD